MKMNKFFQKSIFLFFALLSVMVVGCKDDDDETEVNPEPTITAVSPTSGAPGTAVTISGTNLADATTVTFGSTIATMGVKSATSIATTVPADAEEGAQTITVRTAGGTATVSFTVTGDDVEVNAPVVTGVDPVEGAAGTEITITGTDLEAAAVTFGDVAAVVTANTATSITTTVPDDAIEGEQDITVTTAGGIATQSFTVIVDGGTTGERLYVHNDGVVLENGFMEHGGNDHQEALDRVSTEQVFEGESSIKFTSAASPNGQFGFHMDPHGTTMSTGDYTHVVFSVYGGEGAGDIRVYLREKQENGSDVAQANIVRVPVTPVAGEWTTFKIPITDLGTKVDLGGDEFVPSGLYGPVVWFEMMFESVGSSEGGDVRQFYVDEIYFE